MAYPHFTRMIIALVMASAITTWAEPPRLPLYSNHTNLLVVRDAAGQETPVRTTADWAVRRAHILGAFEQVAGPLPGGERRVPLDLKMESAVDEGAHVRHHVTYATEPGDRATAWLLVPKGIRPGERRFGVVALHQTTAIGKDEPAGLGGLTNLHYGRELALRGHVVICPDYHRFGERRVDPYASGWVSATMKGIWDHQRAVDVLVNRLDVDADRIAVIGHSLGGHNSVFLALFDERVRVVVSSCGYNAFPYYYGGKIAGWSHDGYMPRLKSVYHLDLEAVPFDWPELVAALAPRGFFTNAPKGDENFAWPGVVVCEQAARPVYELLGIGESLVFAYPNAAHDFPLAVRRQAYEFLEKQLESLPGKL